VDEDNELTHRLRLPAVKHKHRQSISILNISTMNN